MEYANEDRLCFTMEELSRATEDGSRKRNYENDTKEYRSKNLEAERRRREKLSSRLLMLRSLVPNITNMNKGTIVDDAITYIKKLQDKVESLTQVLHNIEATSEETIETKMDEINAADDMKKWEIQEEVRVEKINENEIWVKIIIEKKRGRFTKLMEAMNNFGIVLIDTNLTTTRGAFLITGCTQGMNGERLEVYQIKKLLQDIIEQIKMEF